MDKLPNAVTETRDDDGLLHSIDGRPAYIDPALGVKEWYLHGKLHREDGPAKIGPGTFHEHRLHGVHVPNKVFLSLCSQKSDMQSPSVLSEIRRLRVSIQPS